MDKDLQVENGHYTRIVNPLIEKLIQVPFKGCEFAVAMFIIRKTYGFQKTTDAISLTQFEEGMKRSRVTVISALKNLEDMKIVVKTALPYRTNTYKINKYFDTWGVVKTGILVKSRMKLVKAGIPEVVKAGIHTKEKRNIQKKLASQSDAGLISQVIKLFEEINPSFDRWYANPTQRGAVDRLLVANGYEKLEKVIALLPKTNAKAYFPTITTPLQLETDWAKLKSKLEQEKDKTITKGRGLA